MSMRHIAIDRARESLRRSGERRWQPGGRRRRGNAPLPGPPIRKIATASAVTHENFGTISSVLELRDGRVPGE